MAEPRRLERLQTGVPGLDEILEGGPIRTAVYVIEGSPGAGKTILANQICFTNAARGEKSVYFTLLTEAHDRMLLFLRELRFFDAARIPEHIRYVSGFRTLETEGLAGVLRAIRDVVSSVRASVLVLDGLVSIEESAENDTTFKKFVHDLQSISSMFRCTVFLLTNIEASKRRAALHTMVDGILRLEAPVVQLKPRRTINVPKFRGGEQLRGTHSLEIDDDGITVLPRVEIALKARALKPRPLPGPRAPFGVPGLDGLTLGGLYRAANTMLLGPSGAGKTVVALRFLAGGLELGETCLYFGFYEQPQDILRKARRLGMDMQRHYDQKKLVVDWHSAVEVSVDGVGHRLLSLYDAHKPQRIVVDGMHGFQSTSDAPERIADFFAALADFIQAEGIAMVYTAETPELIGGPGIQVPFPNASVMAQSSLLLRLVEFEGVVHHAVCVAKMRDGIFDGSIRKLLFEPKVDAGDPFGDADRLLSGLARRVRGGGGT